MKIDLVGTKYVVKSSATFNKGLKKSIKQGKDINKFREVLIKLANGVELEPKYRNHNLIDNKYFKHCMECHIEPDWLLIYQYIDNELILLLVNIGSHSDLFR